MSAIPLSKSNTRTRIAGNPTNVNSRARTRPHRVYMEYAVVYFVAYLFLAFVVYVASGLIGNMCQTSAWRTTIQSKSRLQAAGKSVAVLSDQVNGLSTSASLEKWAIANGYVLRDETGKNNGGSTD